MGGGPELIRRRARLAADLATTLVVLACRMLLASVAALALIAVGPVLAGMTSTAVMSDSMAPGIVTGDVVVVRPADARAARVGQVLLVDDPDSPGRLRLHRLVEHRDGRLVLRGDANAQPDSATVAPGAVRGIAFLRVPWIGLPAVWARTGRVLPVLVGAGALGAAAAAVVILDPRGVPGARTAAALLGRIPRVRRLGALLRPASGGVVLVVGTALAAGAVAPTSGPSWAAFSGTTASRTNQLQVPVWPCPALPSAGSAGPPGIAYSFNPASGAAEPNRGSAGSGFAATVGAQAARVAGGCASGSTPALRFPGTANQAVVGASPGVPAYSAGTQTLWFKPASTAGVLESIGSGSSTTTTDRQLYFSTSGQLSYAMHNGSAVTTCAIPTAVGVDVWHFAAAVYDTSAKTVTLYLDGAATPCGTTITPPANFTAPTRVGADLTIAADASAGPYSGSVDEVYAWGSALNAAQVETVRSGGH